MRKDILQNQGEKSDLPDFNALIQSRVDYQEYLDNFENRPPLTECTGPMSFDEWTDHQNAFNAIIKAINNFSNPDKN
ncbi:hypothetical protein A2422_00505 [Candidatus Woesebacteria bacterium RIFOXYC1_FULL_31_51]|uniref:Uncharacterized protein n=1 Tax=Candidatus Woesebacteria bacterium GW2011_GWC2_31_9 TaxID=1618586 RepID=A0A0F9YJM4_9BACT|nr:MAG: hypothetical protein UR17_C0001G0380 [Candidatus Woesebacteria bacterium GW2011_GWF1_31_35]KKP23130.1 MAG: hypothetical protein UR11_C0001G0104 [Candidatus Woesebacteria bacterium GW2011_GWC1_30_29]KKP26818.1 MAG: hypothetical protein UR13_C0002G0053 [Candidatus Woesebacteria bacterium GW2011_GWD1_31_12]KKP27393.1 MAG: hypothetical protein UR16_C0003G0053 [Candidatus Woesebacteria bacterium GW2011_GWB1_31_29]KKP31724.1 MAG: hypothetical protein UR21_C0006G0039 [Candidatus Woesebacteria 